MRRSERPVGFAALVGVALSIVGCGGCSPSYVLRAAYEEGRILWSRQPIEERLAGGGISADERAKLELVVEVRRFAADDLGMRVGGAYDSVAEVPPGALLWVVSASERLRLHAYTWWFPIAGDVSYKGFFHREDAEAEAASLQERGYDTYVRPSAAFSTLGWFDDPVLSTWLRAKPLPLVRLVIHELLHRTTYVAGQTSFNESFATFVGGVGAVEFFSAREGPDSETARLAREDWRREIERSGRWGEAVEELRRLYREGADGARTEAEVLEARRAIFAAFSGAEEVNNAVILAQYAYATRLAGFDCVLREAGGSVRAAIARIRSASEGSPGDPFVALEGCGGAAPPRDGPISG